MTRVICAVNFTCVYIYIFLWHFCHRLQSRRSTSGSLLTGELKNLSWRPPGFLWHSVFTSQCNHPPPENWHFEPNKLRQHRNWPVRIKPITTACEKGSELSPGDNYRASRKGRQEGREIMCERSFCLHAASPARRVPEYKPPWNQTRKRKTNWRRLVHMTKIKAKKNPTKNNICKNLWHNHRVLREICRCAETTFTCSDRVARRWYTYLCHGDKLPAWFFTQQLVRGHAAKLVNELRPTTVVHSSWEFTFLFARH